MSCNEDVAIVGPADVPIHRPCRAGDGRVVRLRIGAAILRSLSSPTARRGPWGLTRGLIHLQVTRLSQEPIHWKHVAVGGGDLFRREGGGGLLESRRRALDSHLFGKDTH